CRHIHPRGKRSADDLSTTERRGADTPRRPYGDGVEVIRAADDDLDRERGLQRGKRFEERRSQGAVVKYQYDRLTRLIGEIIEMIPRQLDIPDLPATRSQLRGLSDREYLSGYREIGNPGGSPGVFICLKGEIPTLLVFL